MTDEHLTDAEAPLMVTINSKDATRHKNEMHIRGKMVIELAKALGALSPSDVAMDATYWIREARRLAEGKP